MKSILKIQSVALVFLLICSVFVSPVMAGDSQENVVEDGVHLVKLSDSPTKLDHHFYDVDPTVNFVVDGNQFYWVRIGNVKASDLSTHALSSLLCYGVFLGVAGVADGVIAFVTLPPVVTAAPPTLGGSVALYFVGVGVVTAAVDGSLVWVATKLCPIVEKQFVDNKYRYVASDGTILIGIAKTNTAGISELKKNGLDITKLTHLSSDGSLVPKPDL